MRGNLYPYMDILANVRTPFKEKLRGEVCVKKGKHEGGNPQKKLSGGIVHVVAARNGGRNSEGRE